jgi:vWA-MoxR associated protein C-terminal domain/vWA-MoxR associated protein middle region 0
VTGGQEPEFASLLGEDAGRALRGWLTLTGRTARPTGWLTGGRTSAQVAAIMMESPGEPARKLILKVCPPGTGEPREPGRHREALRRSPRAFIERHLVRLPHDPVPVGGGGWLMFQDVADGSLARLRPLSELLTSTPAALGPACAIILRAILQSWNPANRMPALPVRDFLQLQLGRRLQPGGPLERWSAFEPALWDDATHWLLLPGETEPVPNPVALARDATLSANLNVEALLGNAHGDLNLDNILIPYEPSVDAAAFRLIDLSRYSPEAPLARDPQHLLLSVVAQFLEEQPDSLLDALLDCLADGNALGEARLPVWLRDTIVAVRRAPESWASKAGLEDEWVQQSRLSLLACALMFVSRDRIPRGDRSWFFLLAARVGGAYLRSVDRYEPVEPVPVSLPGISDRPRPIRRAGWAQPRTGPDPEPLLEHDERNRLYRLVSGLRPATVATMYQEAVAPFGPRLATDPDDLAAVVRDLEDAITAPGGLHPLIRFLEMLAEEVHGPVATALRECVDHIARRLRVARLDIERLRSAVSAARPAQRRSYVIVQLQEDGVDRDRFLMSVWLRPDDGVAEVLHLDEQPHLLHELPDLLDDLLSRIPELASRTFGGLVMEFVLPRQLLCLEVDQWRIAVKVGLPRRLGIDQPVVVRSLDRIRDPRLHYEWRRKWNWLQRNGHVAEPEAVRWLQQGGHADLEALMAELMEHETPVCLVLPFRPAVEQSPGQDPVLAGILAGIPVMLIFRAEQDAERVEAELKPLLEQGLLALPEVVLQIRRKAVGQGPASDHPGRHLTLLWDDPNRIPQQHTRLKAPA